MGGEKIEEKSNRGKALKERNQAREN